MKYYLVGIKGTGMSALALTLHSLGYEVIGSDKEEKYFTEKELKNKNIKILSFNRENINIYNDAISMFPGLLIALIFGYKKEKFIDEDNIENNKMLERTEFSFDKF